jgi:hypothetical protein
MAVRANLLSAEVVVVVAVESRYRSPQIYLPACFLRTVVREQ